MGSENRSGKVPLISKIAYGFGDVGCNFSWMFVSNFLMIFYTDVFGISMAAVSALMLFSRFWDAINDPIVGGTDRQDKDKMGKIPSMAFGGGTDYGGAPCNDILGKTRLESDCKNCIYGNHILSPCFGIYLCEYSIWNTLWSNDTGH